MFCKNCGAPMGDFDTTCPNCGANYGGVSQTNFGGNNKESIKTTGLLVWSIIELLCVNIPAGIIALILWFTKLKPAADKDDAVAANKAKKPIKIVLWLGLIFTIIIITLLSLIAVHNLSAVQDRMQVSADKAMAAQIGKAVRIWHTDATMDPINLNFNVEDVENDFVRVDEIEGFEEYMDIMDNEPICYGKSIGKDGAYYATIINEDKLSQIKVVIAIGPKELNEVPKKDKSFYATFNGNLEEFGTSEVTYDGNGSGIAWVEP